MLSTNAINNPITTQNQKQKLEILLLFSISFFPSATDIAVQPPAPINVPNACIIGKIGIHTDIALIIRASPVFPIKKTSAILYTTITRVMITVGRAREAITCHTFPVSNFFCLSISYTPFKFHLLQV